MAAPTVGPHGFDVQALFAALDAERRGRGLSWRAVAAEMAEESEQFNARLEVQHPISPATVTGMTQRRDTSCQHAVVMLRWLGRPPEDFIAEPRPGTSGVPLPDAGPDHMLRWHLGELHSALDEARRERGATWDQTAHRLHCTANQLTGLRTARYATGMRLAMRICQALRRPAADFIHPAQW